VGGPTLEFPEEQPHPSPQTQLGEGALYAFVSPRPSGPEVRRFPSTVKGDAAGCPSVKRRLLEVSASEVGPLLPFLAARLSVPPSEAEALVQRGAVYLAGKRVGGQRRQLRVGDKVLVVLEESGRSVLAAEEAPLPLRVLFEDKHLLAVDKPAGLPAQATPGGATHLAALATAHLGHAAGLVHRLDKGTTGLTLFGVTAEATSALASAFRLGQVRKQYLAATAVGLPEGGTVSLPLSRDPSRPGRWRASARAHGLSAVTEYQRLAVGEGYALAVLWPRTGRTHQLRAHLASLGAPLLSDALYGGPRDSRMERPALHAHALVFPHPDSGARLTLVAPLPLDLARLFSASGTAAPAGPLFEA
jgi:23S rRNA pseudouridine1911/1915/1917 synthase